MHIKLKTSSLKKHQTDDAKSEGRMYDIKGNLMSSLLNTMFNGMIIDTLYNVHVYVYVFYD